MGYKKSMNPINLINHLNKDWRGHCERYRTLTGLCSLRTITALDSRLHEKLYGIPDEQDDRVGNLVHSAVAYEAVGTFMKETAEYKARSVLETSSSTTASAA